MKNYWLFLCTMVTTITSLQGYVLLPQPNNITTFKLDTAMSDAGWKNLIYCVYDTTDQSVQCLPDSQQNIMIYKRSNLTETLTPEPPKRTPGDTAVLIGTFARMELDPNTNKLIPVTHYVWKMRYENPR